MNQQRDNSSLLIRKFPVNGKIKPVSLFPLTCGYCGKTLKNENAHSGHMKSCTTRIAFIAQFRKKNAPIFADPIESKKRWDTLDHSYFELVDFEIRYSKEAIDFILQQIDALTHFTNKRLEKYCVFYLLVLAQIADKKTIRQQAHALLSKLLTETSLALLHRYWSKLGSSRYEPTAESYSMTWTKFVRIKDDSFFYVDYPAWILLVDRYILTYNYFGWTQNLIHKEDTYFMDMVLFTIRQTLYLEQDCIGIPATECYQTEVPSAAIPFLHRNSRERFSVKNTHWTHVADIGYDPSDPASALCI
jgi:hypothetical protein